MNKATVHVPGLKVTVPLAADALPRDLVPMEGPATGARAARRTSAEDGRTVQASRRRRMTIQAATGSATVDAEAFPDRSLGR
jgi:hypothetical protein